MYTSDFDYNLPPELIAQTPVEPRDSAQLMVVDRATREIQRRHFFDIVNYLGEGDLLVWNNTKVFKARLRGEVLLDEQVIIPSFPRRSRGGLSRLRESRIPLAAGPSSIAVKTSATPPEPPLGKRGILNMPRVEVFLVRPMENKFVWKVLAKPARRLRLGMKVRFADDFVGEVMLKEADGTLLMQFAEDDLAVRAKANKYGEVPVPPYIRTLDFRLSTLVAIKDQSLESRDQLVERYQTVYAKNEGSVAAPTAGFHFTPELIEKLEKKGVEFAEVTLHVGLGTFLPVKTKRVEDHQMHSEQVELTAKNADIINQAKAEGRRVVAVGTTTVRTLEALAGLDSRRLTLDSSREINQSAKVQSPKSRVRPYTGDINLFITPGFKFQIVDALITNFHLPKSTLLMLVCAFAEDREFMLECYQEAIKEKYRFYSFGDAMLIK